MIGFHNNLFIAFVSFMLTIIFTVIALVYFEPLILIALTSAGVSIYYTSKAGEETNE